MTNESQTFPKINEINHQQKENGVKEESQINVLCPYHVGSSPLIEAGNSACKDVFILIITLVDKSLTKVATDNKLVTLSQCRAEGIY